MKNFFWLLAGLAVLTASAQETPVALVSSPANASTAPTPTVVKKWGMAVVPWDAWFKDNAMVTDKTDYVHFFWDAQDFKPNFEVKDKQRRLAEAAVQLVSRLYPADAKADQVKVDIVYVLERDSYGQPKWDSLQQVAHFEFLRSKALKLAKAKKEPAAAALRKIFDKSEMY
jgi:hypothetical protein